ncbi:MAG: HAMP domain-containing protein [Nitrospirae bacterium]|nr:HAMP domain-containing protein [Nitrospirota bacterium]
MNRIIRKTGFQQRVVAVIVLIGMASVALGLAMVYFFGRASMEETIGATFQELAVVTADNVEKEINAHLHTARTLTLSSDIVRVVGESNASYEGSTEQEIARQLAAVESRWAKDQGVGAYLHALLTNEGTAYLRSFDSQIDQNHMAHLQILVVDGHGAVVAATKKPRHFDFSDQEWRRTVMQSGQPYLGDITFSEEENAYIFPIAYPVLKGHGEVAGVLYTLYNAPQFFRLVTDVRVANTDHTMLVSSDGEIIFCPILPIKRHSLGKGLQELALRDVPGWVSSEEDVHYPGRVAINGFAPVPVTFKAGATNFGGKHWYILTSQDPKAAFAPIYGLLKWVALAGLLGSLVVAVLGFVAARRVIRPINMLRDSVERVSAGDLDHKIEIQTGDEIEELAQAFNHMSEKLNASYSGLEAKIVERTRELEVKNRELFTLYTIVSSLNEAAHNSEGFGDALNKILVTLHVNAIGLTVYQEKGAPTLYMAPKGALEASACRSAMDTLEAYVQDRNLAIQLDDITVNPRFNLLEKDLTFKGVAVMPVMVKDRMVGMLHLLSRQPRSYTTTERALITSILNQLGVSIEHLRLVNRS